MMHRLQLNSLRTAAWLLLISTLVGACATAPPAVDPMQLPEVPKTWSTVAIDAVSTQADPSDGETTAPPTVDMTPTAWWAHFGSAELDAHVDEALQNNYNLRAASAAVDAALAQARLRGADARPQASARFDLAERQQVFVGLPVPGSDGVLKSQSTSATAQFGITWEADLWGRLRAARQAVGEDAQAAAADQYAVHLALAAQVAKTWIRATEAKRLVEIGEATLSIRRDTFQRAESRFQHGVAPSIDVRLARVNSARAEAEVETRRRALDGTVRQLEILLGRPPIGRLEVQATLPQLPPPVATGLPAEMLRRRPDLMAAEARLAAAGWRVAEARAAFYPRLTLSGSAGTSSDQVGDLLDGDFSIWSLAGGLLQPIFQGGRLRAAADFAQAGRERSLASYAQTLLRALGEVETTLRAETFLHREVDALSRAEQEAQRAARLAEKRYRSGVGDFLAVLESQRQAFEAESLWVTLSGQRLRNRIDLHLALGGDVTPPAADHQLSSPTHPSQTVVRSKSEEK